MSQNRKFLTTASVLTANVWQLQISRNRKCHLALCLNMSGNRQCLYGQCLNWLCLAPESVWQQKVSFWFKTDFVTQRKMVRNGKCRRDGMVPKLTAHCWLFYRSCLEKNLATISIFDPKNILWGKCHGDAGMIWLWISLNRVATAGCRSRPVWEPISTASHWQFFSWKPL